jgi:predicted alpha-1,2-mannosidase
MRTAICILLLALTEGLFAQASEGPPVFKEADVFLGVDADGNTTPGAQVPFGFIVLQPDTERPSTSGYRSAERIIGFSHTHVSGTGGASKYGNFRVTPMTGSLELPVAEVKSDEVAWPGYYAVTLRQGEHAIRSELTATRLVGFHRYTFPRTKSAHLVMEVSSVILNWWGMPQRPLSCDARAEQDGHLRGRCRWRGGWNPSEYQLYFAAEFDHVPTAVGACVGSSLVPRRCTTKDIQTQQEWQPAWAWASFDTSDQPIVQMKVAVSFIGYEKAQQSLREVADWNFDRARQNAERLWTDALATINVEGGTPEQRNVFYSSLYRVHVMPHELTGENVWWQSSEPHYEDYYTLWDTFRTLHPLLTLIQRERQRDMVRSMIDTYRHTGWMPDSRIAGANGLTQGGSNGDVLIADAIVKGLDGIDYKTAYEALIKNAETDSPDHIFYGREKMSVYKTLGYMPLEQERSGSRTMEYAYDDFAIAQVAHALGKLEDAKEYTRRSLFWANLWDTKTQSVRPRHSDGRWMEPFDRTAVTYPWSAPFYEGNPWQYSTYVPHDVQGLINRLGGDEAFTQWLDEFFKSGNYNPGNEPDLLAPWFYIHAGHPERTQATVRNLLAKYYKVGREGLPGNDDAGAMTSWFIWSALGIYPNAGQNYYYIGSPIFSRSTISLGAGKSFVIEARNAGAQNRYIQAAMLNGKALDRAFLQHSELISGGTLVLTLGPEPSTWGRSDRPFSVETPVKRAAISTRAIPESHNRYIRHAPRLP